ncbi:MAG: bifunctional folylpolyglutamate synthase/dihydrofolate synthase [Saprospiraceae bacterium]|nr:bifunctional folylpolyglutamate synthase/dihydrofolate synthase [Saprospiraceae bacterium]
MTYRETLDFLYAQLPMYHRIGPAAFKKDLTNTLALCEYLGNPHLKFRSIHVGGTNGKGSVSHILAAVCQAAGLKTGLYISPHYKDFRERIKVNGQYIPRAGVVDFMTQHRAAIERIQPSFFELCVAMAFDHFAREQVAVAVIEVGLGGRLDSTNVITPLLSVITNISYDHVNMLGDTLPQIAFEKAGIIKPGIPVVIGETHPESAPVFLKKASETGSEIVFADQHFEVREVTGKEQSIISESTVYNVFKNKKLFLENLKVQAAGPYQARNLATALQAVEMLAVPAVPADLSAVFSAAEAAGTRHFGLPGFSAAKAAGTVREGLARLKGLTRFMGRWQVIGRHPTVLCDSAHNEAGLRSAFENINRHMAPEIQNTKHETRHLHVVTGFVNDKDVDHVLGLFPPYARYYFAKADIPRGLEAAVLKEKAAGHGLKGKSYTSVKNALKAARRAAAPEDLIVVTGSIFVVAEVL